MWHGAAELWGQMGAGARVVLVVLLGMSVTSLTVASERLLAFRRMRGQSRAFAAKASRLLADYRVNDTLLAAAGYSRSHVARVVASGLVEYRSKRRVPRLTTDDALESARRATERSALIATAELKRGTGSLATIGATAPFVGLFGTVLGIIDAFATIARTGQTGLSVVAAGVAEALVTTAVGLLVALPAVWLYNGLMQRIERFQVEMASAASELLDRLVEQPAEGEAGDRQAS